MAQKDEERYGVVINTKYPLGLIRKIDKIVDGPNSDFMSRADFLRQAAKRFVDEIEEKELDLSKKTR